LVQIWKGYLRSKQTEIRDRPPLNTRRHGGSPLDGRMNADFGGAAKK
jgi:hypothetical protein